MSEGILLEALEPFNYKENVSLQLQSTFKIGGKARFFFQPKQPSQLVKLIQILDENKINFLVFGRASNIVFADVMKTDYIITTRSMKHLDIFNNEIKVEAGLPLRTLCYRCAQASLSGLEGLSGIPGSVGGAVYMNAGAYGYTISDYLTEVRVYDRKQKTIRILPKEDCGFDYRESLFQQRNQCVLQIKLKLKKRNQVCILADMKSIELKRTQKQPLDYPSAGSVFKKPSQDFHPALEIESLGLKGYAIGGACVSQKHSGFIITKNQATAKDVKRLIGYLKEKVYNKTGISLETEIEFFE